MPSRILTRCARDWEVRAFLANRKTQWREVLKPQPHPGQEVRIFKPGWLEHQVGGHWSCGIDLMPTYAPGDLIVVKETMYQIGGRHPSEDYCVLIDQMQHDLLWDDPGNPLRKKIPSSRMSRRASRLTLEVTDVRVQAVQEIGEESVLAEGFVCGYFELGHGFGLPNWSRGIRRHQAAFKIMWNERHGLGAWERNDWVIVPTVKVHHGNVDDVLAKQESDDD